MKEKNNAADYAKIMTKARAKGRGRGRNGEMPPVREKRKDPDRAPRLRRGGMGTGAAGRRMFRRSGYAAACQGGAV